MKTKHIKYHKDGKLDGYWKWYRKDGTKMRTGYFKDNKQVGEWMTYDKTGKLVKKNALLTFLLKYSYDNFSRHCPHLTKRYAFCFGI